VKNAVGAIGYVEYVYAVSNNLAAASLVNKAGKAVKPTEAAFRAAADQADWAKATDLAPSMINLGGDATWPIVTATYILLPKNPANPEKAATVMKFFDWAYGTEGETIAEKLHYITIPDSVAANVRKAWTANVKGPDGRPVSF
jgi:phosphate transport system substrate-binding protein